VEVVAEAKNGHEAIEILKDQFKTDVLLTDLHMPGINLNRTHERSDNIFFDNKSRDFNCK
jgi:CheY-like chemotaxis protein